MLPRERVLRTLGFKTTDKIALEYHPSPRGLYEHGEKLRALFKQYPGDFEDMSDTPIPVPDPENLDGEGNYHEFSRDEWGTLWEYRIFSMTGHPQEWPLEDMSRLSVYKFPKNRYELLSDREMLKTKARQVKQTVFYKTGWFGLLEKMIALRRFEDVLMDIAEDNEEINILADRLTDYHAADIAGLIEAGVDGIQFGDDYGTQQGLILSPDRWRSFFKPRLERLIKPVKDAGIKVFFHSCGMVRDILDDFKEMGVDAIWPQLPLYDMRELSRHCRDIGLAAAIHIDRAHVMTHGSPGEVEEAVEAAVDAFRPQNGGSWFYVEIDNDFPFKNVQALMKAIGRYR